MTHRGDNPANGGWGHVLSFGLSHQGHPQVLHIEHHALQQSLFGVSPVLRQLYSDKNMTTHYSRFSTSMSSHMLWNHPQGILKDYFLVNSQLLFLINNAIICTNPVLLFTISILKVHVQPSPGLFLSASNGTPETTLASEGQHPYCPNIGYSHSVFKDHTHVVASNKQPVSQMKCAPEVKNPIKTFQDIHIKSKCDRKNRNSKQCFLQSPVQ